MTIYMGAYTYKWQYISSCIHMPTDNSFCIAVYVYIHYYNVFHLYSSSIHFISIVITGHIFIHTYYQVYIPMHTNIH